MHSALADSSLTEVLDQAMLLTAELSTNVVMHTGSNLDLEVATDRRGVTVTVADNAPGAVHTGMTFAEASEGGFGLMLVDRFSHSWGINHHPRGKAVWFRLERDTADALAAAPSNTAVAAVQALLEIELAQGESVADFAERLLNCVAEWLPADAGVVRVDHGDAYGIQELASLGPPIDQHCETLRLPIPVTKPWNAEIVLRSPESAHRLVLTRLAAERLGLALERQRVKLTDLRRRTWLTFLAEASELLAQSLDPELTAALIPRLVVPRLGSWCAVYTIDDLGRLELAAVAHSDESELTGLMSTLDEDVRELDRATGYTPLPPPAEGFMIPLVARGQQLGLLAIGRHDSHRHQPDELGVVEDLARRAALAIDNARIHQERRRIAHALQQSLLPPELPAIGGLELSAQYVPIGDDVDVGGDFYDVIPMPGNKWLLIVGDVSGKGIQAANVTGLVRDVIRVLIRDGRPLRSILLTLNDMLFERGGRYCTLAMAVLTPRDDKSPGDEPELTLQLAGHDQPFVIRGDGSVVEVGVGGTAVGLLKDLSSPTCQVTLLPGEAIVFYTDGVTERRRRDEFFGTGRLKRVLSELAGYPAEVIAARLSATVLGFSNEPPRDDIAILVLRNNASP